MNCSDCNDPVGADAAPDGWGGRLCARCAPPAPPPPSHTLTLTLEVAPGVEPGDVVDYLNCEALCRMEEDDRLITGWAWGEPQENTTQEEVEAILADPRETAMNRWDGERDIPKEVL